MTNKKATTHEEFKAELLKDPEFRREYEALKPKYEMIKWGLRCGQLMAEEKAKMNIIERTAWAYRLERIGEDRPSLDFEDHSINETHTPEPERARG